MNFKPLSDRVVVKVDKKEKTAGGILLPENAKETTFEAEVVAVGPGARNEHGKRLAMTVQPGDRVLYVQWSGTDIKIDGQDYVILRESDLVGVLVDDERQHGDRQRLEPVPFDQANRPLV